MGKSMSTAKQVNRSTVVKVATESTQPKPNQQTICRAIPDEPNSAYLKKVNSFDESFNDRLKQVFVTSVNKNPTLELAKDRSMPQDRTTPFALAPHTQETDVKKPNTLLVNELSVILKNHKEHPETWTIEHIGAKFNISKEIAEKLVANYGSLQTFFAGSTSESDKFLQRQEPERRIRYSSTHAEVEDIMTAGVEKKMKTRKNVEEEVVEWWNKRPAK